MANEERRYTPVLDEYVRDFGLKKRDLAGKRILDAGAGMRQFAADCVGEEAGEVWSVALDTVDWLSTKQRMEQAEKLNPESEWLADWRSVEERSQCGWFENLPYASERFDLVLSRYGLAQAIENVKEMEMAMLEVIRVLRPGGEARFFPGWTDNWPAEQKLVVWEALSKMAKVPGVALEVKRVEFMTGGLHITGAMVILGKE